MTVNAITAISSGSHAPWTSLVRFAARNIRSTSQQRSGADHDQPQRCSPPRAGDVEEQQRGDRDRAGDRHAERDRPAPPNCWNANTRMSTETMSSQLIHGT